MICETIPPRTLRIPHSAFRTCLNGTHDLPRGPPHLPRPRGRGATPRRGRDVRGGAEAAVGTAHHARRAQPDPPGVTLPPRGARRRSEEHTSELQSQSNLVCRLLLEKKKKKH